MTTAHQDEALLNATNNVSMINYSTIFSGFAEKGIDDVQPRVNVFTFNAWKALGRSVKKGEHGVKLITWVAMSKKTDEGKDSFKRPRSVSVFHISQTEIIV